nr:MAG TPA: hypothetical protein [Caudoviricetes sp.]
MHKKSKRNNAFGEQITNVILLSVTTVIIHEEGVEKNGT